MLSRGSKKGISFQFVKKKHLTNLSDSCMIAKSGKKSIVSGTWVRIMEEIFKQTLLYDFYGELLTEHQKSVYEDFIFQDLSLSEIAALRGISRQGVFDLLHRINKSLENYEKKLHLVERFLLLTKDVTAIEVELKRIKTSDPDADVSEMEQIINHMREMI